MRKILDTLAAVLAATLFLSFTAFMSVQTYRSAVLLYERFWSSQHWNQVQGRIIDVQAHQGCGRGGRGYDLDVKYDYQIGVNIYINYSIFIGSERCYSLTKLEQLKVQFPIGHTVPVYVDPHRPLHAVLVRELNSAVTIFLFLIELSLLIATLMPIRFVLREWRENKNQTLRLSDILLRRSELDNSIRIRSKP